MYALGFMAITGTKQARLEIELVLGKSRLERCDNLPLHQADHTDGYAMLGAHQAQDSHFRQVLCDWGEAILQVPLFA
jgi:hypothetical protein